jgi:O-antigen/teichoic acid export membrane protein
MFALLQKKMAFIFLGKSSTAAAESTAGTTRISQNILLSFLAKGGSIIIGLVLVPLTINYVTPLEYGIWITISSIISWMNFFDVGLGNGLRNTLSESLAHGNYKEAKKYVSTTYALIIVISLVLFTLFSIINVFINWNGVLNLPTTFAYGLTTVVWVVFLSFCVQFVVQLLNIILTATHQAGQSAIIAFAGQLFVLLAIIALKAFAPGNLLLLVNVLAGIPIVVTIIASFYYFNTRLKNYSPSVKSVDLRYGKKLFSLGGVFFVIQMGALILFQTDNFVITRLFGPEAVTEFSIAYKLFSLVIVVFNIIITPYWSAFSDAFAKQDFRWIKKSLERIRHICLLLSLLAVALCVFSKWIYSVWLGNTLSISTSLTIATAIYSILYVWQTAYVYLLNGIGKVRLQLILVVISALINLPIAFWLGREFGLTGVITANSIVFAGMTVFFSMQTKKIIAQTATGIWNK